jgi:hypothetical protein
VAWYYLNNTFNNTKEALLFLPNLQLKLVLCHPLCSVLLLHNNLPSNSRLKHSTLKLPSSTALNPSNMLQPLNHNTLPNHVLKPPFVVQHSLLKKKNPKILT